MDSNTFKHTPGPWIVNEDFLTVEAGDLTVCTVEPADKGSIFLVSHGVTEANARLLAAAPELLDVVDETIRMLTLAGIEADASSNNPVSALLARAEAVRAQATGAQQPAAEAA